MVSWSTLALKRLRCPNLICLSPLPPKLSFSHNGTKIKADVTKNLCGLASVVCQWRHSIKGWCLSWNLSLLWAIFCNANWIHKVQWEEMFEATQDGFRQITKNQESTRIRRASPILSLTSISRKKMQFRDDANRVELCFRWFVMCVCGVDVRTIVVDVQTTSERSHRTKSYWDLLSNPRDGYA